MAITFCEFDKEVQLFSPKIKNNVSLTRGFFAELAKQTN